MTEVKLWKYVDGVKTAWCCTSCGLQRVGIQGKVTHILLPCQCGFVEPTSQSTGG